MKQLVVGLVFFWSLFAAHSAAQRGGSGHGGGGLAAGSVGGRFHGGGFTPPAFNAHGGSRTGGLGLGLPPLRPIPPLGSMGIHNRFRNKGYGWGGLGWGYPDTFDGYGDAPYGDDGYQSPMIVSPEEERCGPVIIQPPPPPVRPELHEYKWPDSNGDTAAAFVLMMADGSVHPAIAVWVQDNTINYITPEGAGGRLGLHSLNREGTRLANAAKHLTLWLPGGSQSGASH
jgi:hypothetical protein